MMKLTYAETRKFKAATTTFFHRVLSVVCSIHFPQNWFGMGFEGTWTKQATIGLNEEEWLSQLWALQLCVACELVSYLVKMISPFPTNAQLIEEKISFFYSF